jgi:hypothetical protein
MRKARSPSFELDRQNSFGIPRARWTDTSMKPGIFFAVLIMMAAAAAILFAILHSAWRPWLASRQRLGLQPCKAVFDFLQIRIDDLERIPDHIEPTGPLLQFAPEPLPMGAHFFKRHAILEAHKTGDNQPNSVRHLRILSLASSLK